MDIKYHIETAWKLCIDNILPLVILTLVVGVVSTISFGIMLPVCFAGYIYSLNLLMKTNREPIVQDAFSQLRLFLPLFVFSLIVGIIAIIGFTLLLVPGFIFTIIIGYTCLYMLPIMVDLEYGLMDAIKKSIAIVTRTGMVDHIIVFVIFSALTTIGASSFIGFLLLQPFATLFLLSAYEQSK